MRLKYKTNLLIVPFNRPHYLKQVLGKINVDEFENVFCFVDGPRNQDDAKKIKEVVRLVKSHGIKKLSIQKANLGIVKAFEKAISWYFSEVDEGIILEDDCVPDKSFFTFAAKMLETYRDETRIGMVSGSCVMPNNTNSYFFSKQFGIWGWATWKNRWSDYKSIKKKSDIKLRFFDLYKYAGSFPGALMLYTKFQRQLIPGKAFWDINWVYTNALKNRLCIIPDKNLISNVGHVGNSSFKKNKLNDAKTSRISITNLKHPKKVAANFIYDSRLDYFYNFMPAIKSFIYQQLIAQNRS